MAADSPSGELRSADAVFYNRFTGRTDRRPIQYVVKASPPKGSKKYALFSTDGKWAVLFFHDPAEAVQKGIRSRIEAILGPYNPTLTREEGGAADNTADKAGYFRGQFCWPVATVDDPKLGLGIVCPKYPARFSFGDDVSPNPYISKARKGKEKKSTWFVSEGNRQSFRESELGDFRRSLSICVNLARSVRRLHAAGLAHSDLSGNNVLVDPKTGSCIIIDIDSLVVPGIYPPEVIGTPWYIAPEVLETKDLPFDDPAKQLPKIATDLHAMAVMIYELLFLRHPLEGPRSFNVDDPEQEDLLIYGSQALFIEDPADSRNRVPDLKVRIGDMGPRLADLFVRAFCKGLHDPRFRPPALEWESVLMSTMDLLAPCENKSCSMGWFVLHNPARPVCPFCGASLKPGRAVRMTQKSPVRGQQGQWVESGGIILYKGKELYPYHFFHNCPRGETADLRAAAVVNRRRGKLFLANRALPSLSLENGDPVPPGQEIELRRDLRLCTSRDEDGILLEFNG